MQRDRRANHVKGRLIRIAEKLGADKTDAESRARFFRAFFGLRFSNQFRADKDRGKAERRCFFRELPGKADDESLPRGNKFAPRLKNAA